MDELLKQLAASIEAGEITSAELGLGDGRRLLIRVETEQDLRPFRCPHCSRRAKSQRGLTKHINTRHGNVVSVKKKSA